MKRSYIADSIIQDWNKDKYWKKLAKRKKNKCKINEKMQCDKCEYAENCLDKE